MRIILIVILVPFRDAYEASPKNSFMVMGNT
jgi:hypothetical protein